MLLNLGGNFLDGSLKTTVVWNCTVSSLHWAESRTGLAEGRHPTAEVIHYRPDVNTPSNQHSLGELVLFTLFLWWNMSCHAVHSYAIR